MKRAIFLTMIGLIVAVNPTSVRADDDWQDIFDGETLDGWTPNERLENWSVEDGAIVGRGERSHLYYTAAQVKDFELKTDVMINEGGNSGIYFHIVYHDGGWFMDGHEVQINNTQSDPVKTGSLWGVLNLFDSPVEDDTWFTVNIKVEGQNIVVSVNDEILYDYTEPEGAKGERKIGQGYIAFQQHDPGSSVRFRNIMLRHLPAP